MSLSLDFGWYSGPTKAVGAENDFKEEYVDIDGKKAQIAIFNKDAKGGRMATLYVVTAEPDEDHPQNGFSKNVCSPENGYESGNRETDLQERPIQKN